MRQVDETVWAELTPEASPAGRPAPLVRRVAARTIDFGVWLGAFYGFTTVAADARLDALVLVVWGVVWLVLPRGATAGKRLCGLRVARTDGTLLTLRRALLREACVIVSFVIPVIGVLMVLVILNDPRRQGLHDKLADTLVTPQPL
ncbi:RDD family protein [Cryptosporangium sp. NPDC051539]|uniref:RDD family protein n=1 Tax=Cryptosporangium sp. NPDC051539 TaxID=3363962 RepID=UPI00379E249A